MVNGLRRREELRKKLRKAKSSFKRTFAKPKPIQLKKRFMIRKKAVNPAVALTRVDASRVLQLQKLTKKKVKRKIRKRKLTIQERVRQLEGKPIRRRKRRKR